MMMMICTYIYDDDDDDDDDDGDDDDGDDGDDGDDDDDDDVYVHIYDDDDDDPHIQQDLRQKPQIYLLKPPIRCVKGPHFGFFAEWPEKHPETETMALSEKRGLDRPNKNTWKELTQQKTVNLT